MKKKLTVLFSLVLSLTLLSCSNEGLSEFGNSENEVTKSDTHNADKGVIVPYEVDIDTLPPMISPMSSSSDYVLSNNLRALREFPFRLKSTSNGRYMRVDGAGQEVRLDGDINDDASKFYVKVFASSTGIPYMLYSKKTNTPLTVGIWPNDPNTRIVYARHDDPSTGFEMSVWDIFHATTSQGENRGNGAVVIESKFYIGDGGGGGPYGDPFNYVMNAANNTQLRYARYENNVNREFIIEPTGNFTLEKIDYINAYSAKVTPKEIVSVTLGEINESFSNKAFQFKFLTQVNETSSFVEEKGINFTISNLADKKFKNPNVINGEIDVIPNASDDENLVYNTTTQVIRRDVNRTLPVTIKPRTKLNATYHFQVYSVEVDYEATITNNGKICKLVGRWKGDICVDDNLDPDFQIIDLDTRAVSSLKIDVSKVTTANDLTL